MSDQQPQQPQYGPPPGYGDYQQPQRSNGLAVASLVCGIVSLLFLWFILGPLAIIFGGVGLSRANKGASGRGLAIAGLVCGIVAIIGYLVVVLALVSNHRFVI